MWHFVLYYCRKLFWISHLFYLGCRETCAVMVRFSYTYHWHECNFGFQQFLWFFLFIGLYDGAAYVFITDVIKNYYIWGHSLGWLILTTTGKSKKFSEEICSSESLLEPFLKQILRSLVQTRVHKYKLFWCASTLPRTQRKPKRSPSDQRKLVMLFRNNPGTNKAQASH